MLSALSHTSPTWRSCLLVFLFAIGLLVLTSTPASATIIGNSGAGVFIDDMNPADLSATGWASVACANCAKGSTGSGLITQGPGGGDPPGDGNYLKAKDNQNTGFWIAAPDAFGSTTCNPTCIATVGDLSHFDGDQIYFTAAFLGNAQQFGQGFGVGFGNVTILGGTACSVTAAGQSGCMAVEQDFGAVLSAGTFYLFSGSFSRAGFTLQGSLGTQQLNPTQWAELLKNIHLITIDVSTHTTNSNDSIGIDEFGFTTTPEPATFGLIGLALAGGALLRRRRVRE